MRSVFYFYKMHHFIKNVIEKIFSDKKINISNNWIKFKNYILGGKPSKQIKKVKVTTLDKLLFNKLISKKILLKIDVEGAETEVLQGSAKILKKCNVVLIQLESSNYKIYKNSVSPLKFLLDNGFIVEKKFTFPLLNFQDVVYRKI